MSGQDPGLITIERVVAFVLSPIISAVAGLVTLELAKHGIHVDSGSAASLATGVAAGSAATAFKWLDGRAKTTLKDLPSPLVDAIDEAGKRVVEAVSDGGDLPPITSSTFDPAPQTPPPAPPPAQ